MSRGSKRILIAMSTNAETFDFHGGQEWESCTLERCNIVSTNNSQQGYIIHIEEMPDELLTCASGDTWNRVGTFCVGEEPFNPTEHHTIRNFRPSKPLDGLTIKVHDASGNLANISNPFHIRLRIDKPIDRSHSAA